MLRDFRFKCYCEACINNYKTLDYPDSSIDRQYIVAFLQEFLQEFPIAEFNLVMDLRYSESIWKFYDRACKFMDQFETKNYSVQEISFLYFYMVNCLWVTLESQADLNWK